jgi:AraC family transcriptional regulator of adaptative response/methylated-DNA-[protein]-cysteine methyltransferase
MTTTATLDPLAVLSDHLKSNADANISLDQMSRLTGYSPYHLQRKFKAAFGVTPKQFQTKCRLDRLKSQLRQGNSVTNAMYGSGYGSSSRLYEQSTTNLGMTPAQYKARGQGLEISWIELETPLGPVALGATDRGLCFVEFGESKAALYSRLKTEFPQARLIESNPDTPALRDWHAAILNTLTTGANLPPLPLDVRATAFEALVWTYLRTIPAGETRSYGDVAEAIGRPKSHRAVANACGRNPVALAIPCHRVIRSSGELGGYRWGLEKKTELLARESKRLSVLA